MTVQSPTLSQNHVLNIFRAKGKRAEKTPEKQLWELFRSPAKVGAPHCFPAPWLSRLLRPPHPLLRVERSILAPPRPRPRPRPAADVSCYVSGRAGAPAGPLLPRRLSRPREVAGALGTAAETRAAHLSGAGAPWLGSRPGAAEGAVSGLFFLFFFRTVGPRALFLSAETATPPPGPGRGARPPERRRPPA